MLFIFLQSYILFSIVHLLFSIVLAFFGYHELNMSHLYLGIQYPIIHYLAILEISPSTPYNFDRAYTEKEKNS